MKMCILDEFLILISHQQVKKGFVSWREYNPSVLREIAILITSYYILKFLQIPKNEAAKSTNFQINNLL